MARAKPLEMLTREGIRRKVRRAFPKVADKEVRAMVDTCLKIAEQNLHGINFTVTPSLQVISKQEARRYRDPEVDFEEIEDRTLHEEYDRIPELNYIPTK